MEASEQAAWDERYSGTGRAVDLGIGEGRNTIWLAEHGWQVTAVDFSAVGLDRAARLAERPA